MNVIWEKGYAMAQVVLIIAAILLTIPGAALRLLGMHIDPLVDSGIYGLAVVGAAFLLSWGAEVAQHDIPRSLALTILALIAVLPEYAVDMYLAWQAAGDPATYGPLALVNMSLRARKAGRRADGITLDEGQNTEILFLGLATLYSFLIPIKGTLDLIDVAVLVTIFGFYAWQVSKAEQVEPELIGPARVIGGLPDLPRRLITVLFFAIAGAAIVLVAEPFAESLIAAGTELGFDRRTLVQWLAPLASETPEFIITGIFAARLLGAAALGALVSSKVNQWTLLVGTVPLVFNLASYVIGKPVPAVLRLDHVQRDDLLLTSAQSAFAVAMLLGLHLSLWEAAMLTGLFLIQLIVPQTHTAVTIVYLVLSVFFVVRNRTQIAEAVRGLRRPASTGN